MMGKRILLFVGIFFSLSVQAQDLSVQEHFDAAKNAYELKEFDVYLDHLRAANEIRPNHPVIVYKLAGAWSLNKRKSRSIQTLNQMMLMDATVDFANDPDFDNIRGYKGYDKLLKLQRELATVEVHDELYAQMDAAELHPESFVILEDGTLLLGSVRQKRVVKVLPDGSWINWLDTPFSVTGMKISEADNTLWIATAAMPEMEGYEASSQGNSVVLQVDLNTGLIIQGLEYDEQTLIGDIEPDGEKRLWISNSMEAILSRDDTDTSQYLGAFTRLSFDLTENYLNLQGLTLSDDENYLYFSDYIKGLFRVNIELGDVEPVFAPKTSLLKGIDGLYYYKNSLIAIHNGTKPYKVVQYFLNEEGTFIDLEQVINRGGESLGEPTLGQVKDGYFYYLANSPWAAYSDGELRVENWGLIEIRRIKLD